jgi:hypothetical protein
VKNGVWKVKEVAPLVLWVDAATTAGSIHDAWRTLSKTTPGTAAVVERGELSAAELAAVTRRDGDAAPVPGRVVARDPNHLAVEVNAPADGVAVIAEAYYKDWQVTVDGRPARLFPVNVLFRGVHVTAGTHRIEMRYRPTGTLALATLHPLAWIAALALLVWDRRRRR